MATKISARAAQVAVSAVTAAVDPVPAAAAAAAADEAVEADGVAAVDDCNNEDIIARPVVRTARIPRVRARSLVVLVFGNAAKGIPRDTASRIRARGAVRPTTIISDGRGRRAAT